MIGPAVAGLSGLVAGSAHVVTGPDHLAAVLPLAAGQRKRALGLGALWGLGHGLGVVCLGALGRLLNHRVDLQSWSNIAELIVGLLLIVLGIWTLVRSRVIVVHEHRHPHQPSTRDSGITRDHVHAHVHVHVADETVGSPDHGVAGNHRVHSHSAFGFGMLHGTAGAGHLFGVLPSLTLSDQAAGFYLSAYFVAAIFAMTLFAGLVGTMTRSRTRLPLVLRFAGSASLLVGLYWTASTLRDYV